MKNIITTMRIMQRVVQGKENQRKKLTKMPKHSQVQGESLDKKGNWQSKLQTQKIKGKKIKVVASIQQKIRKIFGVKYFIAFR